MTLCSIKYQPNVSFDTFLILHNVGSSPNTRHITAPH